MVRIVVGPEQVVDQVVLAREVDARGVLLEGAEAVRAVELGGQHLELGEGPHVVLMVGLVHRRQRPRDPADAGLDRARAESREALEDARGAHVDDRLHGHRQRVEDVVGHRAAVAPRAARVAPGRDMERDRQPGLLDRRPELVELGQIVVARVLAGRSPDRLGGEGEAAEAALGRAVDLGHRAGNVAGGDAGQRRGAVVGRAERVPGPVVPGAAHRVAEHRVGRGPHREPLVGEDDLAVHPVQIHVAHPLGGVRVAVLVAHQILAGQLQVADFGRAVALGDLPAHAVLVHLDARQAVAVFGVDALLPEVDRLVHVAVGGDHEVFVGVAGPRGARPAGRAGRLGAVRGDFVVRRVIGLGQFGGDHRRQASFPAARRSVQGAAALGAE